MLSHNFILKGAQKLSERKLICPRYGLRHPLTWLWAALFLGPLVWWRVTPQHIELPLWERAVFYAALLGTFLWNELRVPALEKWLSHAPAALFPFFSAVAFLQTEASLGNPFTSITALGVVWCLLTALSLYLILYALLGRVWLSGLTGSIVFTVLSLINYFTLLLRGTPVCPADIFSGGAAANVVGAYRLSLTPAVMVILVLFLAQITFVCRVFRTGRRLGWKTGLALRLAMLAAACGWIYTGYFTRLPWQMGFGLSEWNWKENYLPKGFICTTGLRVTKLFYQVPAGYSDKAVSALLDDMSQETQTTADELPNIVLIVNESWFDWRQVTDFTTDLPVTPFLDELENSVRGFAVNSAVGTSASEYEILTSNSLCLFPANNPFTQMDLSENNSLARYLSLFGYESSALHPCPATNYNRNTAYPALGFDHSYFVDSPEVEAIPTVYVHGGYSDFSSFDVLKSLYENRDGDSPVFLYNLTYQNHGGYQQADFNGGSWVVDPARHIHITSGFEAIRSEVEEYLTSLSYTDEAFELLVEYFADVEEPTILCMVGDHAPTFSQSTPDGHEGYESAMLQRGTPFIIWANFPIEEQEIGYIGMPQLVPLLLNTAGIELSPYYQALDELSEEIPLLASAFYRTADGEYHGFNFDSEAAMPELSTLR